MLTTILIAGAVLIIACITIIALARKASNTQQNTAGSKSSGLTQEQNASLNNARSVLTNSRMTISRIKDQQISQAGIKACESVEKVLHTLKEKPEKIQTTRQLFNYYLPTLEKVVSRYQRLESSGTVEKDMPEKVRAYLDNVTEAMGNLYEELFDNDKLNVAVDMEAMTIAIKRDGLLDEEDFKAAAPAQAEASAQTEPATQAAAPSQAAAQEELQEGEPLEMNF